MKPRHTNTHSTNKRAKKKVKIEQRERKKERKRYKRHETLFSFACCSAEHLPKSTKKKEKEHPLSGNNNNSKKKKPTKARQDTITTSNFSSFHIPEFQAAKASTLPSTCILRPQNTAKCKRRRKGVTSDATGRSSCYSGFVHHSVFSTKKSKKKMLRLPDLSPFSFSLCFTRAHTCAEARAATT